MGQFGSTSSKTLLTKLFPRKNFAFLEDFGRDRYGRTIAKVYNWNKDISTIMKGFIRKILKQN